MLNEKEVKQARELMREFVKELKREHLLKNEDDAIYNDVSERLYKYYKNGAADPMIAAALKEVQDDLYLDIIPLYYKDKHTIEEIAEIMSVDVSTIVRNKKRLCLSIYVLL